MLAFALVGLALLLALSLLCPELVLALGAKEGPIEQCSHAILVAGAIAWFAIARRDGRRWVWLMACWLVITLGEEIDWGGVYHLETAANSLDALIGHRNAHNAAGGLAYVGFAAITAALLGCAWRDSRPRARPTSRRRVVSGRDAVAVLSLGLASIIVTLALPRLEESTEEFLELYLYGALLWIAARPPRFLGDSVRLDITYIKLHETTSCSNDEKRAAPTRARPPGCF